MNNVRVGIKENITQFTLLVLLNLFVGSMVGLERTLLPIIGEQQFGIASASAALSFIISFGFSKAIVNFFAGQLADRIGRKYVLLFGWVFGLFVPIIIIFAHSWWEIVFANVFLGINQGLTWSMTVNMKVDLSKSTQRGFAIGLNEFAGYSGVALTAAISGYVAAVYSLRPQPFYIGIVIAIMGLLLSLLVKSTDYHLKIQKEKNSEIISLKEVFKQITWKNPNLSSISFAGLATNLKDGMVWGLFPLFFLSNGLTVRQFGMIVAIYPAVWGFVQLFTGVLSDKIGRKFLITFGMWIQAISLWSMLFVHSYIFWLIGAVFLGIGTAMVYPTLIASVSDVAHPSWRATALGIYRFWRDSGYAFGALIAGLLVDLLNINWAIGIVALLPLIAGILVAVRMEETLNVIENISK